MRLRTVLAILAVAGVPALATAEQMTTDMTGASPADKALAESMGKMMKNMGAKPTGNTDRDFVTLMTPHHQGAIDMARVELRYGKDPMLRDLAAGIVAAQEKEIAEMKAWQAKTAK